MLVAAFTCYGDPKSDAVAVASAKRFERESAYTAAYLSWAATRPTGLHSRA